MFETFIPLAASSVFILYVLQAMTYGVVALFSFSKEGRRLCLCHLVSAAIYGGLAALHLLHMP